jgi:hypothetical protein
VGEIGKQASVRAKAITSKQEEGPTIDINPVAPGAKTKGFKKDFSI